jgi:hypothetical protein
MSIEWVDVYMYNSKSTETEWSSKYEVKRMAKAKYNGEFIDVVKQLYVGEDHEIYKLDASLSNAYRKPIVEMANYTDCKNYYCVKIRTPNYVMKNFKVHRIVASTLLPIELLDSAPLGILQSDWNILKKMKNFMSTLYGMLQVNHIDHDTYNYKLENLEWCTGRANINAYHDHAGF